MDTPDSYEVEGVTEDGKPTTVEIVDVGEGELSVAIVQGGETVSAFTADQVDELVEALRRANGGE